MPTAPLGPATDIEGVLARMHEIETSLPAVDGVAAFNRLYTGVTESVRAAVAGATFENPAFLARLDVVFANLFFFAYDADLAGWASTPRAWYPLFAARGTARITPLQFALAGMNAHINRDLMVALVQSAADLGIVLADGSPEHRDYLLVNQLLEAEEARIKAQYLPPVIAAIDRVASPLDDVVAMWSIAEARAAAWSHGKSLAALAAFPALADGYLETIDGLVGLASRGLLRPL
jgi:hypothetical protein